MERPEKQPRWQARLRSWVGGWAEWGSLIWLFLALEVAVHSIEQAEWITPQPSLTGVLALAIGSGWLVGKSRLPGHVTHLFMPVLGLVVAVWQTSGISQLEVLLQSSWQAIRATGPSEGTTHFAVFIVFATWIIGYLSTWFVLRKRNAWVAASLGAAAILVNASNLPEGQYASFFVFFIAGLLLLAQTNLAKQYDWFRKNGVSYPGQGAIYFAAFLLCLGTVMASIAWLTPEIRSYPVESLVATKVAWRKNVNEYFTNLLAAIPAKQPFLRSGQQEVLSMGDIFGQGDEVQFVVTSEEPLYWRTRTYDIYDSSGWKCSRADERMLRQGMPATEVSKASGRREMTYTVVTKLRTDVLLATGEFLSADTPALMYTLAPLSFEINVLDPTEAHSLPPDVVSLVESVRRTPAAKGGFDIAKLSQAMPKDLMLTGIGATDAGMPGASYPPLSAGESNPVVSIRLARVQSGPADIVAVTTPHFLKPGQRYQVTASVSLARPADLSQAGSSYPHRVTDHYLQLPPTLSKPVRELSEAITKEARSPYDKALAIKHYLSQFRYRAQNRMPPAGTDAVDYFLSTEQSGNCLYFASAMAVMLRSVGVPTRLCVGYLPGELEETTGTFTLRAKQHHAWPEVYFPGHGWVELEATPVRVSRFEPPPVGTGGEELLFIEEWDMWLYAGATDVSLEDSDVSAASGKRTASRLPSVIISSTIGFILLLLILRSIVSRWLGRFRGPDYPSEIYGKMCFLASLLRLSPQPQQTPLEYCARLSSVLPLPAEPLNNIVQAYVQSRFSRSKGLSWLERGKLQKSWRQVYPVLLRRLFRVRYFFSGSGQL